MIKLNLLKDCLLKKRQATKPQCCQQIIEEKCTQSWQWLQSSKTVDEYKKA